MGEGKMCQKTYIRLPPNRRAMKPVNQFTKSNDWSAYLLWRKNPATTYLCFFCGFTIFEILMCCCSTELTHIFAAVTFIVGWWMQHSSTNQSYFFIISFKCHGDPSPRKATFRTSDKNQLPNPDVTFRVELFNQLNRWLRARRTDIFVPKIQ